MNLSGHFFTEMSAEAARLCPFEEKNEPSPLLMRNIINRICILLCGALDLSTEGAVPSELNHNGDERLYRLINFVRENYRKNLTLAHAAELTGLTEEYIGSKFRKNTGLRFGQYVNSVRLHHAAELLGSTVL